MIEDVKLAVKMEMKWVIHSTQILLVHHRETALVQYYSRCIYEHNERRKLQNIDHFYFCAPEYRLELRTTTMA